MGEGFVVFGVCSIYSFWKSVNLASSWWISLRKGARCQSIAQVVTKRSFLHGWHMGKSDLIDRRGVLLAHSLRRVNPLRGAPHDTVVSLYLDGCYTARRKQRAIGQLRATQKKRMVHTRRDVFSAK